jgi:perosamine synthetase
MMGDRNIQISLPAIDDEELEAVIEPLKSGWVTQGPKVAEFEKAFAERHQVPHALAVTSCTTGLHLALAALGVGPGDEVIVPAFTWVATANVVLYCGATPVFIDVDATTYNLDVELLAGKITKNTKAIIAVHLFGRCVDIDAVRAVVPDNIAIVEDAACAAGASLRGVPSGGLGDVGVYSFHPRKTITTGEGGMVTTIHKDLAEKMDQMRNHGAQVSEEQRHAGPKPYLLPDFNLLGFNYRMTDMQGAVGIVQLSKLDRYIEERAERASFYKERLGHIEWLQQPFETAEFKHGWQAYVTTVLPEKATLPRNDIMEMLQSKGIATRPGTHAVHMLTYYRDKFGFKPDDFPVAKFCNDQTMAIPLHNRMSSEDYEYVVDALCQLS